MNEEFQCRICGVEVEHLYSVLASKCLETVDLVTLNLDQYKEETKIRRSFLCIECLRHFIKSGKYGVSEFPNGWWRLSGTNFWNIMQGKKPAKYDITRWKSYQKRQLTRKRNSQE